MHIYYLGEHLFFDKYWELINLKKTLNPFEKNDDDDNANPFKNDDDDDYEIIYEYARNCQ